MFFLLFFINFLSAQTDAIVGTQARTFPMVGGEVFSEVGHGLQLWGPKVLPERPSPFYGFIRPSLGIASSAVINSFKGEIDFFPVSFFGVTGGYSQVYSDFDFPFFDCTKIHCRGRTEKRYIEGKLALAHKGYVFLSTYKRDKMQFSRNDLPFGDFRRVIAGENGRDEQEELRVVLGKKDAKRMLGIVTEWIRFRLSGEQAHSTFFLVQRNKVESNLMLGAGVFSSDRMGMGPVIYLRYSFILLPSIKIL